MKADGVDQGIAVLHGKHLSDRTLFDGIRPLGWVAGTYRMSTGNLFRVAHRVLFGTMPMWHIDRSLWDSHRDDDVARYRAIAPVRYRSGFASLLNHGWLTPDRSVRSTD
jgi:hypothetical protein